VIPWAGISAGYETVNGLTRRYEFNMLFNIGRNELQLRKSIKPFSIKTRLPIFCAEHEKDFLNICAFIQWSSFFSILQACDKNFVCGEKMLCHNRHLLAEQMAVRSRGS
jgi:hypothetical protein